MGKDFKKLDLSWRLFVRISITLTILIYLGFKVHWTELGRQFMQSDPVWLFTACILLGFSFLFASIRWWFLLKVQDIFLPLKTVTALTLIGQFFNAFLLGSTGGDVVKIFYIVRYSPLKKTNATLSIIIDRALGLFILLSLTLAVLPWQLRYLVQNDNVKTIAYALL